MQKNEQGLVSIIVTFVMMIVISITVLSFAQIIRREQRQALDNQLSSQAFYAAETGVNDVRKAIKDRGLDAKETCQGDYRSQALPYVLDASANVEYTCVLVDPEPESLDYKLDPNSASLATKISSADPINTLSFKWSPQTTGDADGAVSSANPTDNCDDTFNGTTTYSAFTPNADWRCTGYGVMRIDIVPANATNRADLMNKTFTAFVTPVDADTTASTTYSGTNNGVPARRLPAYCNDTECNFSINGLPNLNAYYLRIMPIYRSTDSFRVTGSGLSGNASFVNTQIVIDSTGKAQDVLRRIQVRVPFEAAGDHADYGIQSTYSICKRFETGAGATNESPDCD